MVPRYSYWCADLCPRQATAREADCAGKRSGEGVGAVEFSVLGGVRNAGGGACVGGGAEGAYRLAQEWQMVLSVSGCKRVEERENVSGDALVYQLGPRWTPSPSGKWSPFAHLLVGGLKTTQETLDPVAKKRVLEANQGMDPMLFYTLHRSVRDAAGVEHTGGHGGDGRGLQAESGAGDSGCQRGVSAGQRI